MRPKRLLSPKLHFLNQYQDHYPFKLGYISLNIHLLFKLIWQLSRTQPNVHVIAYLLATRTNNVSTKSIMNTFVKDTINVLKQLDVRKLA